MTLGLQLPQYCEDLSYPAFLDRYLINDLGIQPGVVTSNSYKVSAGSGLQVNVLNGGAYVESENGPYHESSTAALTPSNSVEVSTVNPQIAQIILRVFDINELKISGQSNAKIEWLNGTPTASATEAKMKEGKFEGAAELPSSTLRFASVLVPKNATSSSEFFIMDRRPWAHGAHCFSRRASTTYTPASTSFAAIDTTNLQLRMECSGVPIRVNFWAIGEASGINKGIAAGCNVNGTPVDASTEALGKLFSTSGQLEGPVGYSYEFVPSAGSNLFTVTAAAVVGTGGKIYAPMVFSVEEIVRQKANNGTS